MGAPAESFRPEGSRFAVTTRRPVAILMVVAAVTVFGWVSYQRLPLTLMPDINYPTLTVRTEYPGSAPEEVESLISRPLEQELGVVSGLVSISSVSKAGQSDVILEFQWKTDMTTISQEIREKIDRVRLPEAARRPLLLHYDPSLDPIMRMGLAGPQTLYELRVLADYDLRRRLETLPGVAAVRARGGLEEEFLVALDEGRLATLGLDVGQVGQRLAQSNINVPGGNLREGQTEYVIRTLNEFRTLEEIGEVVVIRREGVDIRIRDIGEVRRFHRDREVITRVNGRESVELEIYKEADANVVAVAAAVRDAIFGRPEQQAYVGRLGPDRSPPPPDPDRMTGSMQDRRREEARVLMEHLQMTDFAAFHLPAGADLEVLSDQSIFISNAIAEVKKNAILGAIIAIGVLYLFLGNLVHTMIIGVAIPVSIMATFAPMNLAGVSLNIISLGGLALGVGMLVDNAIVVLESIFRCREEGDDRVNAVIRGVSEVGTAVIAATLTSVAVFFPIVFVEGVAGQVFGDLALTVVFSLLASLLAALFFIPMLASRRTDVFTSGRKDELPAGARRREIALLVPILVCIPVKGVLAFTATLLWPVWGPVDRWVLRARGAGWRRLARWAGEDRFGPFGDSRLQPGLLGFRALDRLGDAFSAIAGRRGAHVGRFLLWLFFPLVAAFWITRFVVDMTMTLIGALLQTLLALLLALAGEFFRFSVAVLSPFARHGLGVVGWMMRGLYAVYPGILRAAMRNRYAVLGGALAAFLFCWFVLTPRLGRELIPQVHQGEFNLDVTLPVGTPLDRTAMVAAVIETSAMEQPEVERVATTVGSEATATTAIEAGEHTARVTVRLREGITAAREEILIARLRAMHSDTPELRMEVSYPALFSFKSPIEVEVYGHDLETLKQLSREAEARLRDIPNLVDVRSTLQAGNPEIRVVYDRDRLIDHGLNLRSVAELVRTKIQGRPFTQFREGDRHIDIVVRLREDDRVGLAELAGLIVNPGAEVPVPLSAIARLTVSEGPSEVRRIGQQRAALLTANIVGTDLAGVSRDITAELQSMEFPPGFSFAVTGQNKEMQTSINSMILALGLALFLVYVVMASQFESMVHPLLIMGAVPLALIGVILALWALGHSLSILVFIGLIVLAGIVVNNAIVLVDYINRLRRRGVELETAIVEAGRARLRPILMTTLTTVLGLLPMALGLGEGSEIRAPMAVTIIVGLSTSTLLTLVVIPTLYYQFTPAPGEAEASAAAPASPRSEPA